MADHGPVSKLFGALVIGGSMMLPGCAGKAIEAGPRDGGKRSAGSARTEEPPTEATVTDMRVEPDLAHCQMEFSQNQYDREGRRVSTESICLDDKTDEDILRFIEEARKDTCESPFCGCWLG